MLVDPTPFHLKTYHVENNDPFYPELFPQAFEVLNSRELSGMFLGGLPFSVAEEHHEHLDIPKNSPPRATEIH